MTKVVIVGGVAGGASAAARLRRLDESAEIVMFERGEYISYANCGLPYYVGEKITNKSVLTLQTPTSFFNRFHTDVRTMSEVIAINRKDKTVTVKDLRTGKSYQESYDKLVLSPGAATVFPNVEGVNGDRVFTLRTIPDTYKVKDFIDTKHPKDAVVIGAGYIGIEMAENLLEMGISVTVVEMADQVIAPLDPEMACDVHNYMAKKGLKLELGNTLKGIGSEGNRLSVELTRGKIVTDMVIMSAGVKPDSHLAKDAGLSVNARGGIMVNEFMQTNDPDIYACGDAVEVVDFVTGEKALIPLAGPANKQGRIVADNICGLNSKFRGTQGSAVIKVFDMTVAVTGVNEKTAKRLGLDYDKVYTLSASHATYYPGATDMSIKAIYERKTGKILGAQIVGFDGVDKRCDVFAVAIRAGMTASDLVKLELCYAPPYSSAKDPVNVIGLVIENTITGKVKNFQWHDVADLPRDGSIVLLDTRTVKEYQEGRIEGFINIPLDELRQHLGEIDKNKKVYIHCRSGLRSYVAARILSQLGYDCYNLTGGYRLWETIFATSAPFGDVQSTACGAPVKK
jgi:NADPH-dependent 2,4-dienoyl-CoA reductase/sulfur reductase-like enzyme/rhodanese-related sulfurtransferase